MLTFKESFSTITEAKMKLSSGEKVVKELDRLGKKKDVKAVITGKANKFILYVDETKLDTFKSVKEAEKGLQEFLKVMGV
jgi:hypothetical protein